jgi:hypothetical protein
MAMSFFQFIFFFIKHEEKKRDMKNIKPLMTLVSTPVRLKLKPSFMLNGIITEVFEPDSIMFETQQKESLIDIEEILEVQRMPRTSFMEICNNCHTGVFFRKTSFDNVCAKCRQEGCKGCGK